MDFIAMLALFVLAIFLGVELITKVPPTLHLTALKKPVNS